jgi:chromosomal replication initiator protein
MYLARQLTELSYPDIGAAFGGKNHATVIYAAKKIENKMETDPSMRNLVEGIRKNIRE